MSSPSTIAPRPRGKSASARLVRGSSLLIGGRLISKAATFVAQLLLVRYLARTTFGEFAYALSLVTVVQTVITLGLDRSIVRFLPIYHERGDRARLLGTLVLAVGSIVALGLAAAVLLYGGLGTLSHLLREPHAMSLLLILIFLAPLQALDDVLVGVFAVFARPRAIFFRRYVLAPALKLGTVALLVASHSGTRFLALGYVLSTLVGIAIYGVLVVRLLEQSGALEAGAPQTIIVPWREILGFTMPLLVTDLVPLSISTLSVVLLGYVRSTAEVADLRAVQPAAKLNELVMAGFATLFTPAASRIFASGKRDEMNHLYWSTATWIAILSFPVFAVTFALAQPVTVMLYGATYRQAAPILAMLSLGSYFNAALGCNGLTLKAFGKVRYLIGISAVTVVAAASLNLLLVPRWGTLGAGVAILVSLILHNVLKQAGLRLETGVRVVDWRYARIYLAIAACSAVLMLLASTTRTPLYVSAALVIVMTAGLVGMSGGLLDLTGTFPEAMRLPGMRVLTAWRWKRAPSLEGSPRAGSVISEIEP